MSVQRGSPSGPRPVSPSRPDGVGGPMPEASSAAANEANAFEVSGPMGAGGVGPALPADRYTAAEAPARGGAPEADAVATWAAVRSHRRTRRAQARQAAGAAAGAGGQSAATAGAAAMAAGSALAGTGAALAAAAGVAGAAAATGSTPAFPIPDAHATAGDLSLRYVDLNRQINAGYGQFANAFQNIVDPNFAATGSSSLNPVWFGFAPYASREVGRGELAVKNALDAIKTYEGTSSERLLERAGVPAGVAGVAGKVLDTLFPDEPARLTAAFVVALAGATQNPGSQDPGNLRALLDPRTLTITVGRMMALAAGAPGASFTDKLESVANTMRNALEDGNRRIYSDIGGSGQDYLNYRAAHGGAVTPDQVLDGFSLSNPPQPAQARQVYNFAMQHLNDRPQPTDFEQRFPPSSFDSRNLVVAAFALYEKAGQTSDAAAKNQLIAFGNNLLAYREQHDAVQPAFTPGRVLPGEVDRPKLFRAITPTVALPLRSGTWTFDGYAPDHLPARDLNPLTPRSTEYNWGEFSDRWTPILNAFEEGYSHRRDIWPMPDADPNSGL